MWGAILIDIPTGLLVLLRAVILLSVTVTDTTEGAVAENAREFGILCSLYRIGEAGIKEQHTEPPPVEESLIEEIEDLFMITSEEDHWLNGTTNTGTKGSQPDGWKARVASASAKVARPNRADIRAKAHRRLGIIWREAKQLQESLKSERIAIKDNWKNAREALSKALYGDKVADGQVAETAFHATQINACGNGVTGDAEAGRSLASDFVCLCGDTKARVTQSACSYSGAQQTQVAGTDSALATWRVVVAECPTRMATGVVTPHAIDAALADFNTAIGVTVTDATDGKYIFGKTTSNSGCAGTSSSTAGNCINYKTQLKSSGPGINWVKRFQEARTNLSQANAKMDLIHKAQAELKHLNRTAWDVFIAEEGTLLPGLTLGSDSQNRPSDKAANDKSNTHPTASDSQQTINESSAPSLLNSLTLLYILNIGYLFDELKL